MATANKIQLVSNRVDRAKSFLLAQFRDKPNILAIVEALVEEIQEFENGIIALQNARTLNGSFGKWLDEIGKRNGVERGRYSDNDYKNAIKLAMSRRYSSGQVDNILRIVELLTNDNEVYMRNDYPYLLELTGYFFCLSDSQEGLDALAAMFPLNTFIRFIQRSGLEFRFNTVGAGFGTGASLGNLLYTKAGIVDDPRFNTVSQQIIPPPLVSGVQNVIAPLLSGNTSAGSLISASNGTWTGDEPITFTYQWFENGTPISGATASTITATSGMVGKTLMCVVTASNNVSSLAIPSNIITIDNVVVVPNLIAANLGLRNVYRSTVNVIPAIITGGVTFNNNGTIDFIADDNTPSNWIATHTYIGNDYVVSYQVVNGPLLNIPPNIERPLTANTTFTLSSNVNVFDIVGGEYRFTIRNVTDPTILRSATISIYLENVSGSIN